jgi:hypothetical protein
MRFTREGGEEFWVNFDDDQEAGPRAAGLGPHACSLFSTT